MEEKLCKKLVFQNQNDIKPIVLLGIVLEEDSFFITFRTEKKEYRLAKRLIERLESTTFIFKDGDLDESTIS